MAVEFDTEYVQRLAQRDRFVEEHFAGHFRDLLRIKLRMGAHSACLIEDVAQETLLRVLRIVRRQSGLERPERLGSFVNSVCGNVLHEYLRFEGRYAPLSAAGEEPPDLRMDLDAPLISNQRRCQVESVLQELPEVDRQVLRLMYLEERDKDDVCATLGIGRDYLRVLLFRARYRYRQKIAEKSAERPAIPISPAHARGEPAEAKAYHLMLKARYFLNRVKPDAMEKAIGLFQLSLDLSPTDPRGHAGLSTCYTTAGHFDFMPPLSAFPLAKTAAERALQLSPRLAEAQVSMGLVSMFYDWDCPEAGRNLKRAVENSPDWPRGSRLSELVSVLRSGIRTGGRRSDLRHPPRSAFAVRAHQPGLGTVDGQPTRRLHRPTPPDAGL